LFPGRVFLVDVKKPKKRRAYTKPAEPIKKQEQLGMGDLVKPN